MIKPADVGLGIAGGALATWGIIELTKMKEPSWAKEVMADIVIQHGGKPIAEIPMDVEFVHLFQQGEWKLVIYLVTMKAAGLYGALLIRLKNDELYQIYYIADRNRTLSYQGVPYAGQTTAKEINIMF